MKYVITGGGGHISKPLAAALLRAGHDVTIIGRNPDHLKELITMGAKAAIGSVEDVEFLKETFAGADAVYTMIPPKFDTNDLKEYSAQVGNNYAEAIKTNNIRYVVNLSSIGAHLPEGAGPVSGLYKVEQALNELKNVNIKHLRPNYFFSNFLGNIPMIKHMNIIGSNFGGENFKMVLSEQNDIAEVAAEELLNLGFSGHSYRNIASDERNPDEIAKVIGAAIGKPELQWIVFSDEQAAEGMKQAGLPEDIANNYAEMGHALQSGKMLEDYWKNHPAELGKAKLEHFAKVFAFLYHQQ